MPSDTEAEAEAVLIAAKDAYRADPTAANRQAKADAVADIRRLRAAARVGRAGNAVAGDVFVTTGTEG